MPREHIDFRANLEMLNGRYPNKDMLTTKDVMDVYGYKSISSVYRHFPIVNGRISKAKLARLMCE